MRVMFDTNILLDVFQNRQPHYAASAACVSKVLHGKVEGDLPAHVLTTFYYVLKKYRDTDTARDGGTWLLERFGVAPCNHAVLEEACQCDMPDFEDAVVAVYAKHADCAYIVTRNLDDFANSPLPALPPAELLDQLKTP